MTEQLLCLAPWPTTALEGLTYLTQTWQQRHRGALKGNGFQKLVLSWAATRRPATAPPCYLQGTSKTNSSPGLLVREGPGLRHTEHRRTCQPGCSHARFQGNNHKSWTNGVSEKSPKEKLTNHIKNGCDRTRCSTAYPAGGRRPRAGCTVPSAHARPLSVEEPGRPVSSAHLPGRVQALAGPMSPDFPHKQLWQRVWETGQSWHLEQHS